jgi:hypothetical protein
LACNDRRIATVPKHRHGTGVSRFERLDRMIIGPSFHQLSAFGVGRFKSADARWPTDIFGQSRTLAFQGEATQALRRCLACRTAGKNE